MKREIKFRAKSLDGELIYFELHKSSQSGDSEVFYVNDIPCESGTEQEYTGLKDCKETEIYEGDIVAVENEDDVITVCKWNKGGFTLEDNAGGHWTRQLFHQQERIEVISNIYEKLMSHDNT